METKDFYFCIEEKHPKQKRLDCDSFVMLTLADKATYDEKKQIKELSKADIKWLNEYFRESHIGFKINLTDGTWHEEKKNYFPPNRAEVYLSYMHGIKATDRVGWYVGQLIRSGFVLNRALPEFFSEKASRVTEPSPIDTHTCESSVRWNIVREGGLLPQVEKLLPSYIRNTFKAKDDSFYYFRGNPWKRVSKKGNDWLFALSTDNNLKMKVTTDGISVVKCEPYYEGTEQKINVEDPNDEKFVNFVQENLNGIPTKLDFNVVAAAFNLFLTLPASHGMTSVANTLSGKSVATKKREEYGIAKDYKVATIKRMVNALEGFMTEKGFLKYADPKYNPNSDENAPEWLKHKETTVEVLMLAEHIKELGEKYGK